MTITGSIVDTSILLDADADADLQNDQPELLDTDRLARIERTVMQAGNEIYHSAEGAREALVRSLMYHVTVDGPRTDEDKQSLNQAYDAWLLSKAPDRGIFLTDKQRSAAQDFASGVSSASSGRRYGVASKGYMCMLQKNMRPGDVIAVLEGGRVPYALRPVDGNKYRFLSEVYVEGLIYGIAWRSGELLGDIVLV